MSTAHHTICPSQHNTDAMLQQQLLALLLQLIQPEALYLLGTSHSTRSSSGIFQATQSASPQPIEAVLLILLPEHNSRELQQWQDRIEQHLQKLLPVTALVLSTHSFCTWLGNGHPFAQRINEAATLLHGTPLILPDELPQTGCPEKEQKAIHSHGLQLAEEFLAGADLYRLRRQYNLVAFLLHQAVEQLLFTTLLLGTGYNCQIHNLGRLLRLCSLVNPQLYNIFPQQTEPDKQRFQLLQKAYLGSRYNPVFKVSPNDLEILRQQTTRLLNWFRDSPGIQYSPQYPVLTP